MSWNQTQPKQIKQKKTVTAMMLYKNTVAIVHSPDGDTDFC